MLDKSKRNYHGEVCVIRARSKFADGQHAEIMEVLRLGELEVERSMANPFRKFTALLTEVSDCIPRLVCPAARPRQPCRCASLPSHLHTAGTRHIRFESLSLLVHVLWMLRLLKWHGLSVKRRGLDDALQEGRKARSCYTQYHRIMRDLLDEVKARGARLLESHAREFPCSRASMHTSHECTTCMMI